MAQFILKPHAMPKTLWLTIFLIGFLWAMPHVAYAQACTIANCPTCEIDGNDNTQWSWVQETIKLDMLDAQVHIINALNDAQNKIVTSIQGSSMVKTQIAQNALEQDNTLSDHNNQQAATRTANVLLNEHKAVTTPSVADCVQTNTAIQKLQAEPTRLTLLDAQRTQNNHLLNPRVKLFNQAKAAQANVLDFLAFTTDPQNLADITDLLGSVPQQPFVQLANGQCLASGLVYSLIAEKYGFSRFSQITSAQVSETHQGGAADLRYSDPKVKAAVDELIRNPNTTDANAVAMRNAFNEMSKMGANLIQFENLGAGQTYKWANGKFNPPIQGTPEQATGSHMHVGNTGFNNQATNPNYQPPYSCAEMELAAGKSRDEIQKLHMTDLSNALAAGPCRNPTAAQAVKCARIRQNLIAASSRGGMLYTKSADTLDHSMPGSTKDPNKKTLVGILAKTGVVTGQSGFVIGNKDGGNAVSLMKALVSTDFIDPDFKFNKEAIEKTATGRVQVSNHYRNVAKANIQAAIIDEMASYQMPVMQGGKEAMATLVSALLSDNPTDVEKQSVVTLANRMIGPGDTLSVSSLSKIEMMRFASYNYQQNAAMNPSKTGIQFLFVLTKQVQEKMRQLHMLQMINLIKAIELAQSAGA